MFSILTRLTFPIFLIPLILTLTFCTSSVRAQKCTCNGASTVDINNLQNDVLRVARVAQTVLPGATPALPHALALVMAAMHMANGTTRASSGYAMVRAIVFKDASKRRDLDAQMKRFSISLPSDASTIAKMISTKFRLGPASTKPPKMPPNPASTKPNIAECSTIKDPDGWQPLCVGTDGKDSTCTPQMNMLAGLSRAPLMSLDGKRYEPVLTKGLQIPFNNKPLLQLFKGKKRNRKFANQYTKLMRIMNPLTDRKKTVAEVFSPPAFMSILSLVIDDLSLRKVGEVNSARILFVTIGAVRDAIVAVATYKTNLAKIRPITVLQCGLVGRRRTIWMGPHQGMKKNVFLSYKRRFTPYLTTPSSASYPSGHTAAATAGTTAYRLATGRRSPRASNCIVRDVGSSMIEGKIERGNKGYIKDITDVPNKGPFSKGYVPASKVTVCWRTWFEYAKLTANSRLFAGIHTPIENTVAEAVGRRAARRMLRYVIRMN